MQIPNGVKIPRDLLVVRETTLTYSRPLGPSEMGYLPVRNIYGFSDGFTIVTLACEGGHVISDEQVVLATAVLRLRHPLFAARVSFTGPIPEYVYNVPVSPAHAIKEARMQIEFHAFTDQAEEAATLRSRWGGADLRDALDVRNGTCTVWWGRDVDQISGRYIFGLQATHFVTGGRPRLNLVREFLELLAALGRAEAQLAAYFSGERPAVNIPASQDSLEPPLTADLEELRSGQAAFEKIMGSSMVSAIPSAGLVPDGTIEMGKVSAHIIRHEWSQAETVKILRACKANGVTITQLANTAAALATVEDVDGTTIGDRSTGVNDLSPTSGSYRFSLTQALDVTTKVQATQDEERSDFVLRVSVYPINLSVPRPALAGPEGLSALWAIARDFKAGHIAFVQSPYFWHLTRLYKPYRLLKYMAMASGKPYVPYMSSLGDCTKLLPTRYVVTRSDVDGEGGGTRTDVRSGAVRVVNLDIAGKVIPVSDSFLLWTWDEKLHFQIRHNTSRTSVALVDPYFRRIVDMLTKIGMQ
ncbi:hypothetical protein WOLCODRAFT_109944 [Wolfiporia cocos MD-104 SS10]|uniref:Condensation domain-containing protein n=1 Tax=Wolfiporia cocos (strain MD-104) TaxID=742152 RepID=A0A2H3JNA0_WOLCO|nr:hypothetical protein WOLCODRAFT_109944 [Wolfiporia cocos MD-104 SS10]